MTNILTVNHPDHGDFFHVKGLLRHLLSERDKATNGGDHVAASTLDRVIVDLATPLMLRDNVTPETEEAPADALHTEPEQGDAHQ